MTQRLERRYYSSRSAVEYPQILKTKEEAIADARQKLHDGNGGYEEIYIVEVVKVVKIIQTPTIVEDVI